MVREAIKSKRERGERRPAMMTETDESPREPSPASASTSNDELDDSRLVNTSTLFLRGFIKVS